MDHRHHVIVVGAGFGGLAAVRGLKNAPVDITVIDSRNHHTFQPLLYQVATAGLDGDDICFPVRGIFSNRTNVRVRMGTVTDVDLDGDTITLDGDDRIRFDDLILAAGAVTNSYGIAGVEEDAFGLKSLGDALAVRSHVLMCFERADAHRAHTVDGTLTFVIAGGGPTGVELAGGLMELFSLVLRKDHPGLDFRNARVLLVEAGDRLLAGFEPRLGSKALNTLRAMGVEVMLNTSVESVTDHDVTLKGPTGTPARAGEPEAGRPLTTSIPTRTMVWTAGVRASPLADALGVELTRASRVVVEPDFSIPGHRNVHVVGDMAAGRDRTGALLPQVAPVAMQSAEYVAEKIDRRLRGESMGEFSYVDKGSMATIGRHSAVAQLPGGVKLSGSIGWFAWLGLHLVMLLGFRNRLNVLVNWAWNYFSYDRASRIITESPTMPEPTLSGAGAPDETSPERASSEPVPDEQDP